MTYPLDATIREQVSHHPVLNEHPTVQRALAAIENRDTDEVTRVILETKLARMCGQAQQTGELFWAYYQGFPDNNSQKENDGTA